MNEAIIAQSPSTPAREIGIVTAEYFGVSVDYLLSDAEIDDITPTDELTEYLEELKNRSEMRTLFSLAKGATKEDVMKAVAIIEALRNTDG